jgi:hypothetical protein
MAQFEPDKHGGGLANLYAETPDITLHMREGMEARIDLATLHPFARVDIGNMQCRVVSMDVQNGELVIGLAVPRLCVHQDSPS